MDDDHVSVARPLQEHHDMRVRADTDDDIARLQRGDVYDVIVLGVVDRQLQQGLPALLLGRGQIRHGGQRGVGSSVPHR